MIPWQDRPRGLAFGQTTGSVAKTDRLLVHASPGTGCFWNFGILRISKLPYHQHEQLPKGLHHTEFSQALSSTTAENEASKQICMSACLLCTDIHIPREMGCACSWLVKSETSLFGQIRSERLTKKSSPVAEMLILQQATRLA